MTRSATAAQDEFEKFGAVQQDLMQVLLHSNIALWNHISSENVGKLIPGGNELLQLLDQS
jgi:hypothetical protein